MGLPSKNKININNKFISVIGAGLSGSAAAKLAHFNGAKVFVSDPSTNHDINMRAEELFKIGISIEIGRQSDLIYEADLWIVSPGVAKDSSIILNAKRKNISIISEIEFASWFTKSPIIAVTGSNGKTTTVSVLVEMCQTEDMHGIIAGNIGIPFSSSVLNELQYPEPKTVFILEISSFQMEFIKYFHPHVSVYTNISPDHLDRHRTMDEYIAMKMRMVKNQTKSDFIVYNYDDPIITESLKNHPSTKIPFSTNREDMTFRLQPNGICGPKLSPLIKADDVIIPGRHNLSNILAASTAAHIMGISEKQIAKAIGSFRGVEHRMEYVLKINDVQYINDSKATNLDAVIVSIKSFIKPIVLILGGQNKGADFRLLLPHIKSSHVRVIISYGESGGEIVTALGDAVRSVQVTSLKSAVTTAQTLAIPGDIVLLSPGCASFDQFENFEKRGTQFKTWVKRLKKIND
tara:strand:+ start:17444 stop:18829 length:1386 start_codon:yes stop_codon:yes gene_type:complete